MHKGSIHRVCGCHKRFPVISGVLVYLRLMYIHIHSRGSRGLLQVLSFLLSGCGPRAARVRTVRKRIEETSAIYRDVSAMLVAIDRKFISHLSYNDVQNAMLLSVITDESADDSSSLFNGDAISISISRFNVI